MTPHRSYTIWFSQRTGSTLLGKALADTGIAGKPAEWLAAGSAPKLCAAYNVADPAALQKRLWQQGSTANGIFGLKVSMYEPVFSQILEALRQFPGAPQGKTTRAALWNHAFPDGRHIYMTRRNKVRLAVSWWKAIQTQVWHRRQDEAATAVTSPDLRDAYDFEAIDHLYNECSLREAAIEDFFTEAGIVPLNIVYEDFILRYADTVRTVLAYLGLNAAEATIAPPHFARLADDLSEAWVQRFRAEKQAGWTNKGW